MIQMRLNQWPRPHYRRMRLNENEEADKVKKEDEDKYDPLKHAVLEMLASIVVTYSAIYIPLSEHDDLKQYVSSICIFAVVITLRDAHYFCPDCTPLATLILWVAGLYTDINNQTKWMDIVARIAGQLVGWGVVFGMVSSNRYNLDHYAAIPTFNPNSTDAILSSRAIHGVNEGIGTMVECIAIALTTIPLTNPYPVEHATGNNNMESKSEAEPPKLGKMALVGLALAVIHYTLERLFQASMNPLTTLIHMYVKGEWESSSIVGQLVGAVLAGVYVYLCQPTRSTLLKLLAERKREHGG